MYKYSPPHNSHKDPQFVFFIKADTKFHSHIHNGQNYVYVYTSIFVLSFLVGDGSFTYDVGYGNKNFIRRIITNANSSGDEKIGASNSAS